MCPVRGASFNVSYVNFPSILCYFFIFVFFVFCFLFAMPADDDGDGDDDVVGLSECGCSGASWKLIKRQSNFDNMQLGDLEEAEGPETHKKPTQIFGLSWNSL